MRNQKYNILSFLPIVLYEQFKFFFNLYFLLVALSQFVPALRIGESLSLSYPTTGPVLIPVHTTSTGFLATYVVPLAFVLAVTIGKEGYDDYKRHQRDVSANSTRYLILDRTSSSTHANSHHHHSSSLGESTLSPVKSIPSSKLKVGDIIVLEKNQRVPADILLLRTSDPAGSCFVRTDQLDGETDWKLRVAVERTQHLFSDGDLLRVQGEVYADPPTKDIHTFVGNITLRSVPSSTSTEAEDGTLVMETQNRIEPLTSENMLWANTVLAAGTSVGMIVYTGKETRAVMNTSQPGTKTGLLDLEINRLAKVSPPRPFFC